MNASHHPTQKNNIEKNYQPLLRILWANTVLFQLFNGPRQWSLASFSSHPVRGANSLSLSSPSLFHFLWAPLSGVFKEKPIDKTDWRAGWQDVSVGKGAAWGSIPGTHAVKGDNRQVGLHLPHMTWHMRTHTHAPRNHFLKNVFKERQHNTS